MNNFYPLGKSYLSEPMVLFKIDIFDFYVVMLLASHDTKMKCKAPPKISDKCHADKYHGWMIAKSIRLLQLVYFVMIGTFELPLHPQSLVFSSKIFLQFKKCLLVSNEYI